MTETTTQRGTRTVVARVDDFPLGARRIVEVAGRSIGVLNIDGRYYALRNVCPHHGAPLCEGVVKGTMADSDAHEYSYVRHNEYIVCPWHGYEFSIKTGYHQGSSRFRLRKAEFTIREGEIYVRT